VSTVWTRLGVERGSDEATVRRAYAERLKALHPEEDPESFALLRREYELALSPFRGAKQGYVPGPIVNARVPRLLHVPIEPLSTDETAMLERIKGAIKAKNYTEAMRRYDAWRIDHSEREGENAEIEECLARQMLTDYADKFSGPILHEAAQRYQWLDLKHPRPWTVEASRQIARALPVRKKFSWRNWARRNWLRIVLIGGYLLFQAARLAHR